jgi:hypothetical protein
MQSEFERFVDWANFLGIPARDAFAVAADRLDHFGIEHFSLDTGDMDYADEMEYLNTGDTYSETLILTDGGDTLIVSTWGDWYENAEQSYCEENDAIRCGHCGSYTDCADDWRETVCDNCGNLVGG